MNTDVKEMKNKALHKINSQVNACFTK